MAIETRITQGKNVFADWKVKEYIGSGSGGKTAVFRIVREHNGWEETSALKVINVLEEIGKKEELAEAYIETYEIERNELCKQAEEELRLMSCLRGNPNIVDYYDFVFIDYQEENVFGTDLLIRMELLDNLREEQKKKGDYDEKEIIKIGKDICKGLQSCHTAGIIHRDIKPANIFVTNWGEYELGDFGIARMVDAGQKASTKMGTRAYAAPEQFMSHTDKYDERVDIYGLGLTLYELANHNKLPFASSGYVRESEIQLRIMGKEFPTLDTVSSGLETVIKKACAHDAANRYATAKEFADALEDVEKGAYVVQKVSVADKKNREKNPITKDGVIAIIIVTVMVALFTLLVSFLWSMMDTESEKTHSQEVIQDNVTEEDDEPTETMAEKENVEPEDNVVEETIVEESESESIPQSPVITLEMGEISNEYLELMGEVDYVTSTADNVAVITKESKLYMWGNNEYGQVGCGNTNDQKEPVFIMENVASVQLSEKHSAALTTDGKLYVWGDNSKGQIGNGGTETQLTPVMILENVKEVSLGKSCTGALLNNGELYGWGYTAVGDVLDFQKTPTLIMSDIVDFDMNVGNGGAIDKSGKLYVWGMNWTQQPIYTIEEPRWYMSAVKDIVIGPKTVAVLGDRGDLFVWGKNDCGQVGSGSTYAVEWEPVHIMGKVESVALVDNNVAAITKDGTLYMWGSNASGQVGIPPNGQYNTPQKVAEDVKNVYLMDRVSAFIKEDGTLYLCGSNDRDRIENSDRTRITIPVAVAEDITSVGLSDHATYAVREDGRLYRWGTE